MSSRPSSRASNPVITRQKSLPGLFNTPKQAYTSSKPPPSPSRSTPSPDLTNRNKCPACLQRRPHTHHQYQNDGRTSPSGAAVASSAFGRVRPSVRRLFDEPPSSPTSPLTHSNNKSSNSSPRKEGSRSPSIARSVSSLSINGGDSPKNSIDQRPRWVGAWSSTYTPPPSKAATRRQSLPGCNNYISSASRDSASNRLDESHPLLFAHSPTTSRQPPRRGESYESTAKKSSTRGRSPSAATVCLAARKGAVLSKENNNSPCYTANQNSSNSSRRASVCHPIGEDDDCGHDHDLADEGMEGMHSRSEEDGYVTEPTSSHEGSPTAAIPCAEEGGLALDDNRPSNSTTATPTSTLTDSRTWKFALIPAPPLETSPALIRKFLSADANTGPSPLSSSSSSPSVSGSRYSPLIVTAPAVAAVSPIQFLAKSRVIVTDSAITNSTPGHPLSSALSSSSSAARSTAALSSTLTWDEKESTPSLAASLLSYETTTTLLEQDGDDHSSLARWQQRSPSPLGQYSVLFSENNDSSEENDRSVTPTPSGRAGSLRTRPSVDSLSAIDRPGTPSSCSSPAQELFSRIIDQNNDHISNYSRRHSMGSLVDIVTNKARMYLTPSNPRNSMDGSVAPANYYNNGRRTSSTSSTLGHSPLSASTADEQPHRNSISDPLAPLPPLPPTANTHNNSSKVPQHQQVVRVSSIESFPRHPSSSNLRIQSLRDLFRSSSSTSTTSSSAASVPASSNSNSLTTTPSHSRTPTVETVFDSHHGTNKNSSNNTSGEGGGRRNSLMDLFPSFASSSSKQPSPPAAALEDSRSTNSTPSSSSSSTITRHRSETNGSATSTSTTSSSACPSPVLRKLGSRPSLSVIAPPLVVPQIKQSPKVPHATLLSLTTTDTYDPSTSSPSEAPSSPFAQQTNNSSNGTLRRPKCQVLTSNTTGGNNRPSPLPSFTVVNEIWMDPTTNTLHQLPGVLLTPSLPFPLTLPVLPPSTSDISLSSTTTAPTISQPSDATATSTNKPAVEQQGTGGQPESVEWPWTHMNPADRDRWLTAFHISAQHGGILALPPTYSPGSELDEASALSLSRTHSNTGVIDYGSSVMEARRYFGTGGESVQSSLAGSRVSAGAGSLYYDETLGQTPYGNGYFNGPLGHYGQPEQFAPTHTYQPTGY